MRNKVTMKGIVWTQNSFRCSRSTTFKTSRLILSLECYVVDVMFFCANWRVGCTWWCASRYVASVYLYKSSHTGRVSSDVTQRAGSVSSSHWSKRWKPSSPARETSEMRAEIFQIDDIDLQKYCSWLAASYARKLVTKQRPIKETPRISV